MTGISNTPATGPSQAAIKRNQQLQSVNALKPFNFQGLDQKKQQLATKALGVLQGTSGDATGDSLAKSDPLAQSLTNQLKAVAASSDPGHAGSADGLPKVDVSFKQLPVGGHGKTEFTTQNGKIDKAHITLDPRRVFVGKNDKEKMASFVDTYYNELATVLGLDASKPDNNSRNHEAVTFSGGHIASSALAKLEQGQKPSDLKANDIETLGNRLRGGSSIASLVSTVPDYAKKPVNDNDKTTDNLIQKGFLPAKFRDVLASNHGLGHQPTKTDQKQSTLNLFA